MHKRSTATELEPTKPTPGIVSINGKTFPLESAHIGARTQGGLAQTTLRQTYRNPYAEPLEVTYTLPLPADGAVIGFDIRVGEKRISGEIESHDKALKKYREALETGRLAGILEQERADTFTQNLGNVPPGTAVDVEIRILHPVAFHAAAISDGAITAHPALWEYRFPTVVGVRFEGDPGRVPDSDRLDVDRADSAGTPARLTLDLEIGDGVPGVVNPASASHAIHATDGAAAGTTLIRFDAPSRLDRDVTVRWRAAAEEIGAHLAEGPGLKGDEGRYGLLTIVPPERPEAPFARDLTLLIDASGSMSGPNISAAKRLARRLLESLRAGDRFQILAFSTGVQRIVGTPTEATPENLAKALEALAALEAGGATEMADAIEEALEPLRADSQRQVILMTDGYIGFEREVVAKIMNHLPRGARLHVVGIGSAPNRTLTRGASRAGRGLEVLMDGCDDEAEAGASLFGATPRDEAPSPEGAPDAPSEDPASVREAVARLLPATIAPVLTDLVVEGSAVIAVAPQRPRDVFVGRPAVLALELHPKGGEVRVRGTVPGSREEWSRTIVVGGPATSLPIGAIFGREAIEDEEMRLAAAGDESREVLERIEALGLRHRITSRCTTLVAVADEPSVDPRQPRRRQRLVVEMPHGVNPEAVGYAAPSAMSVAAYQLAPGALAPPPVRALRRSGMRMSSRAEISVGAVRFIRRDGDLLLLEFEAPDHSFRLPAGGTTLVATFDKVAPQGIHSVAVEVDGGRSTYPGPHPKGVTLRLAVRRQDGRLWPEGRVRLVWGPWRIIVDIG